MISVDIAFIQQLIEQKVNIEEPTSTASAIYIFAKLQNVQFTVQLILTVVSVSKTLTNFFVMYIILIFTSHNLLHMSISSET